MVKVVDLAVLLRATFNTSLWKYANVVTNEHVVCWQDKPHLAFTWIIQYEINNMNQVRSVHVLSLVFVCPRKSFVSSQVYSDIIQTWKW